MIGVIDKVIQAFDLAIAAGEHVGLATTSATIAVTRVPPFDLVKDGEPLSPYEIPLKFLRRRAAAMRVISRRRDLTSLVEGLIL